jgi:hypothetical protein
MVSSFVIVTVSIDMDSPSLAERQPTYFGYFPNQTLDRLKVAFILFVFTFSHLLIKIVACTLFASISGLLLLGIMMSEMLVFLLYKVVRKDILWWLDFGISQLTLSVIVRVILKVACDFTGFLWTRHPGDLGPLLWLLTILWNQAMCFVAAYLYTLLGPDGSTNNTLLVVLGGLEVVALLSLVAFFLTVDRRFSRNVFSVMTSQQYWRFHFLNAESDYARSILLNLHSSQHILVREEFKEWLESNWDRWQSDRPAWLNPSSLRSVPDELLPTSVVTEMRKAGKKRRRSSAILGLLSPGSEDGEDIKFAMRLSQFGANANDANETQVG